MPNRTRVLPNRSPYREPKKTPKPTVMEMAKRTGEAAGISGRMEDEGRPSLMHGKRTLHQHLLGHRQTAAVAEGQPEGTVPSSSPYRATTGPLRTPPRVRCPTASPSPSTVRGNMEKTLRSVRM